MSSLKDYLGDGVYADIDGPTADGYFRLVLTTENGFLAQNRIFLEPEVIVAMERFLVRAKNHVQQQILAEANLGIEPVPPSPAEINRMAAADEERHTEGHLPRVIPNPHDD